MSLDKKLLAEFEDYVSSLVGRHYKKNGIIARQRLLWRLTKEWNSRFTQIGIPGEVRRQLGEQEATKVFQDIVNSIIYDPDLLTKATGEHEGSVNKAINEIYADQGTTQNKARGMDIRRELDSMISDMDMSVAIDLDLTSTVATGLKEEGYSIELFPDSENGIAISVKGLGTVYAAQRPVSIESVIGGYNPILCQADEFVKLISNLNKRQRFCQCEYEHIPKIEAENELDSFLVAINDIASLKDSGKMSSFSETILRFVTDIDQWVSQDHFARILRKRELEIEAIISKLTKYKFSENS